MFPSSLHPIILEGVPRDVELWWLDLLEPTAGDDFSVLDGDELARMHRFRFDADARRYARSHVALRLMLGARLGISPPDVRFAIDANGKPWVEGIDWPGSFNMSHSGDLALFGFSPSRIVGVDIELAAPTNPNDLLATARACFADSEYRSLETLPVEERRTTFLRRWSRKEACLKALGSGLSIEPSSFDAGCSKARQAVRIMMGTRDCRVAVATVRLPNMLGAEAAVAWLDQDVTPLRKLRINMGTTRPCS